jgi:hypothetical protein
MSKPITMEVECSTYSRVPMKNREPAKLLYVNLHDGRKFGPPDNATDVFVLTICAIGLDDVAGRGLKLGGTPLVSRERPAL